MNDRHLLSILLGTGLVFGGICFFGSRVLQAALPSPFIGYIVLDVPAPRRRPGAPRKNPKFRPTKPGV